MTRSHTQHAAVETMIEAFKEKNGCDIQCYSQDPQYDDADKKILNSIGITMLDDPKGFLEIDSNTLVFTVSPNVPVKQIIADVQWPGAMLWNTVKLNDKTKWEKKLDSQGKEVWIR